MTSRGYGLPQDPRNPFSNAGQRPPQGAQQQAPAPGIPQPRRDYDADSDAGDHYGSYNSSTTRLAGSPGYYDQNSEFHSCIFYAVVVLLCIPTRCLT